MTDIKTIRDKKDADLTTFVEKQRESLREHRFGTGGSNVKAVKTAKKDIARALTILRERVNETNN